MAMAMAMAIHPIPYHPMLVNNARLIIYTSNKQKASPFPHNPAQSNAQGGYIEGKIRQETGKEANKQRV